MSTAKIHHSKPIKRNVISERFKDLPSLQSVIFLESFIEFHLNDQRIITIPLEWIPKLKNASSIQRENYAIRGHFVFWDSLDEIIGVKNLLNGSIVPNKTI